jgi:hypothetical protein
MSDESHIAVDGTKQPISGDVSEQPEAPKSEASIDDVAADELSVANIERIYRLANPTINYRVELANT